MDRNNKKGKKTLDLTLKLGPSNQEDDEASEENPDLMYNGYYVVHHPNIMGYGFQMGFEPAFVGQASNNFVYQGHYAAQNYSASNNNPGKYCRVCGRTRTPLWRKGPTGHQV
ncbi:GATA transcription factor 15, partial [Striga asiatica]